MRKLISAHYFSRGTLDLRGVFWIFLKVELHFFLLIGFLMNVVVAFFFSIFAPGLIFQEFRGGLSFTPFLIDLVVRGLNFNVVLHAFFQETFVIKGLEHLDQGADVILVQQIFLIAK